MFTTGSSSTWGSSPGIGSATYVGVDDSDTELSRRVLAETGRWSDSNNPYDTEKYCGKCELWVHDIYTAAGIDIGGYCCARGHADMAAKREGKIPKGAIVFSGVRPDGSIYENGHREGLFCDACGNWPGHVAIYVGGGMIAGSQAQYYMSVDAWIDLFGYGGWSFE